MKTNIKNTISNKLDPNLTIHMKLQRTKQRLARKLGLGLKQKDLHPNGKYHVAKMTTSSELTRNEYGAYQYMIYVGRLTIIVDAHNNVRVYDHRTDTEITGKVSLEEE